MVDDARPAPYIRTVVIRSRDATRMIVGAHRTRMMRMMRMSRMMMKLELVRLRTIVNGLVQE